MKLECLYAPHQYRENETWFNECADQGLHLEKWGATHATFSDEEKYEFQYWIDADNGGATPNGHRQSELERLGYVYVTSAPGGFFHVYRAPKGTPDIPDNRKLRKQAGIFYNSYNWFILLFYPLIFIYYDFVFIRSLRNPELASAQDIRLTLIGLFLVSFMLIQCFRDLAKRIRFAIDLSKPVVHERVILKKPRIKYAVLEKYSRIFYFLFFIISTILSEM